MLAVGKKALKVVELFDDLTKEYVADIQFGAVSTTFDREGVIEKVPAKAGWKIPDESDIQKMIRDRFLGNISQVPPIYSAIHIGGERAYRKAMQGRTVNMPAREVEIKKCEIITYNYPKLQLRVVCGSGTYIRSLANDLGELLRCGGYLENLRRTKVGDWSLENAVDPKKVNWTNVMPLKDVLKNLPAIELTTDEFTDLSQGKNIERNVPAKNTIGWHEELPVALLVTAGDGWAHARKVF